VPAQSGSDRILNFIDRAREMMPDVSIASDFIVGFPTETDEDFRQTVELLRHCRPKNSFIFKYSPRPGTVAIDRFTDDVPEDVKRRRNNELLAVQQGVSAANNREMVGKTVQVLVEGESKLMAKAAYPKAPAGGVELLWERRKASQAEREQPAEPRTQLVGRTRGDQVVVFDGNLSMRGSLLDVEIVDARSLTLFGRLCTAAAAPA
jgi:tRNA-2-methylthio-N6-dimethylallyladenosine synthase